MGAVGGEGAVAQRGQSLDPAGLQHLTKTPRNKTPEGRGAQWWGVPDGGITSPLSPSTACALCSPNPRAAVGEIREFLCGRCVWGFFSLS